MLKVIIDFDGTLTAEETQAIQSLPVWPVETDRDVLLATRDGSPVLVTGPWKATAQP